MLRKLLRHFQPNDQAHVLYGQIVAQARQPAFYAELGVPDTPEGRFDMIVLHVVLVMRRLRAEADAGRDAAQGLLDVFFADMDRNLREMGTSDMSVPKKVRGMAEAFYGRAAVYDAAIDAESGEGMRAALERNLYGGGGAQAVSGSADIDRMAEYVLGCCRLLAESPGSDLMAGRLNWAAVASSQSAGPGEKG